jgi:hypothetical protein
MAISKYSRWGMEFNCTPGGSGVVSQGQADYCREYGHAVHTHTALNGTVTVSKHCPRCGVYKSQQIEPEQKPMDQWIKSDDNAFNMGRMVAVAEYQDGLNGTSTASGIYDTVALLLATDVIGEPDYWQLFINGMNEGRNELKIGEQL